MKKILVVVLFAIFFNVGLSAQVPYFAGTPVNNKLYGYTSVKFCPDKNVQETYTISPIGAASLDFYISNGSAYTGFILSGWYNTFMGVQ